MAIDQSKIRNFSITVLIICVLIGVSYYFYTTYLEIDITPEYEIARTESTVPLQTVENVEQESKTIADVLENVSPTQFMNQQPLQNEFQLDIDESDEDESDEINENNFMNII